MTEPRELTDRKTLALHRARALTAPELFLHEEAAVEVEERLAEVNKAFSAPVLIGHATAPFLSRFPQALRVTDDRTLDISPGTFDLALHIFGLHWASDPVGQLVQSRLALNSDGLLLAVCFGGATLQELRASLAEAETQLTGGMSPRVLPMADLRDLGGLLQRAGLALPVADSRKLTVRYKNLNSLARDLRGMGETNALTDRTRTPTSPALFRLAEEIYRDNFSDNDGYLRATFELVFLTGWAPSDSQQKPLTPGSANTRLADALGVPETPLKRDTE